MLNRMVANSIIKVFFLLFLPTATVAQNCQDYEKFWFWPEDTNYCRVFGEISLGELPVLFISDAGMEYAYLKNNAQLIESSLKTVFFQQPAVTQSVCRDSTIKSLKVVNQFLDKIQSEVFSGDSFNIVCHGQGCHFALAYAKAHPESVLSLHMVQIPIAKRSGRYYLQKSSKLAPYMQDLNEAYGAMFFASAHQAFLQSFPKRQRIPADITYVYLSTQELGNVSTGQLNNVYEINENGNKLRFLKESAFWNTLTEKLEDVH
jgi:pimeloyl-ACP methyl ester carboxylesterase